ncbi:MAG: 30S ribosomal protein S3 [Micavibrio sp.]|nr:30S ribosomal protein S3 [Micavibrio sp.]|tara:strand:- start:3067 stop:3789 length:723 start_codon:yes stop_codon:yes gene_type:complete
MGQKVNPISMRLGINRTWDSRWYAGADYAEKLVEDLKLRKYIMKELKPAGISRVIIERAAQNTTVTIYAGRPGMIIGKKGADIESLKRKMSEMVSGNVSLNIVEVRKPEIDAKLVAEGIAQQLERRIAFRRAMKRGVQSALRFGAQGIRVNVSGRLGGADIARMEWYREGRVPLHTLRADLDYGTAEALTTYGIIGIKVWIYKGDIMEHDPSARERRLSEQTGSSSGNRDNRDNRGRDKR